jgi:4-oxalocrotonate tautomerase
MYNLNLEQVQQSLRRKIYENQTRKQKEDPMPYVNIKVTKEGVTARQKEQLIEGATRLLQEVLGKNPSTTFVVIDEVETDNWGVGGKTVTALKKPEL